MNKTLEQYINNHTTPEDPVLEDLYRQTHIRFVNPNMVSGHLQGKFLEILSGMMQPENILEIGTFTGYSAICLARGLKQGGRLFTIEVNDELTSFAHTYFRRAGLDLKIVQMTGNALQIIPTLNSIFDLVFIDGDKREYVDYYRQVIGKVRRGGIIIADNVLWGGQVTDSNTNDPQAKGIIEFNEMIRQEKNIVEILLPLRDGLMIIMKK